MVWLEHRLGRRRTPEQDAAVRRGLAEHAHFFNESQRLLSGAEPVRGRCFVATLLLADRGQATPHLAALRNYRDLVMKRSKWGRRLVKCYYRIGPALCRLLIRHAWLQGPARSIVVALAKLAAASQARRHGRHRGPKAKVDHHADIP